MSTTHLILAAHAAAKHEMPYNAWAVILVIGVVVIFILSKMADKRGL